jgi:hypothetical protein
MAVAVTNGSEEHITSIIRVTRIGEWLSDSCHPDDGGNALPQTSLLTRATQHNIPEDGIPQSLCFLSHAE